MGRREWCSPRRGRKLPVTSVSPEIDQNVFVMAIERECGCAISRTAIILDRGGKEFWSAGVAVSQISNLVSRENEEKVTKSKINAKNWWILLKTPAWRAAPCCRKQQC